MKVSYCWLVFLGFAPGILGSLPWQNSAEESSPTCSCGWVNRDRIVGGRETQRNEFPLVVSLEVKWLNAHFCGGSILTPWHVLTAAHCTHRIEASEIAINVGAHDLARSAGNPRIGVAKIIEHEFYQRRMTANDISLLVTATEIKFTQNVGPACLPSERLDLGGQRVKALGWGLTQNNEKRPSNVLMGVDLRVMSFAQCLQSWQNSTSKLRPRVGTNICTYETNKDTCKGDSGGPLIWQDPSSSRFSVVALVSYGGECGGILPAVNTDVTAYLSWINKNIAASKPGIKACSQL